MRVIIAGSRKLHDYDFLCRVMDRLKWPVTSVVSGMASGVDQMGERWARSHNIPVTRYPAKWDLYGKKAGPIRNQQMADNADALVALMVPGGSIGVLDMIRRAERKRLKCFVAYHEEDFSA